MSKFNIKNLSNENEDGAPSISGISTFSSTAYFVPPKGNTAQRPENPEPGSLRFNTDTTSLEYFRGDEIGWEQVEMTSPDLNGGARGVYGAGATPSIVNTVDYITIPTLGNAIDFGDMTRNSRGVGGLSSRSRGVFCGGYDPAYKNIIEYVTIASTGNATDFGDLITTAYRPSTFSSQTRGLITSMETNPNNNNNIIEYITIASLGNANDFGDTTVVTRNGSGGASSTRGIHYG